MRTKPKSNAAKWAERLPTLKVWTKADSRSIRLAVHNRTHKATANEVDAVFDAAENCLIPVDREHEAQAFKFWQNLAYTKTGAIRNTEQTRAFTSLQTRIIRAYLAGNGHHSFVGITEVGPPNRYRPECAGFTFCIWRLAVSGVGCFDYAYGGWQSGHGLDTFNTENAA